MTAWVASCDDRVGGGGAFAITRPDGERVFRPLHPRTVLLSADSVWVEFATEARNEVTDTLAAGVQTRKRELLAVEEA